MGSSMMCQSVQYCILPCRKSRNVKAESFLDRLEREIFGDELKVGFVSFADIEDDFMTNRCHIDALMNSNLVES